MTLLVTLRTCKRENNIVAVTAEAALRKLLPITSTKESCKDLLAEETKKLSIMVICEERLAKEEYIL
jgi:hypothetical protein